ncbi:unnamed protein product, partial [Ectocarpus sp. 4 AP-2014]
MESRPEVWINTIDATGRLTMKGKVHRRSQSAPLGSPSSASSSALVSQQQSTASGRLSPRRRNGSGFSCPQTLQPPPPFHHHRRASSLATECLLSPPPSARRPPSSSSAGLQDEEALPRPPLRRRAEPPYNARRTVGSRESDSSSSPCSHRGGRSRTPPGLGSRAGDGEVGGTAVNFRSPPRSPQTRLHSRGSREAKPPSSTERVGQGGSSVCPPGVVATASPLKGQVSAPFLGTRRSSDSTVGIADSPQMLPEGLKTDEEDHSGRRAAAAAAATAAATVAATAPKGGGVEPTGASGPVPPDQCRAVGGAATGAAGAGREAVGDYNNPGGLEAEAEGGLVTVVAAAEPPAAPKFAGRAGAAEQGADDGRIGGSLLDAYREPEGNDWGELEDWHGLPGLQLASAGNEVPTLKAPSLIFRPGTVDEGDVLSLHGRPRSRKPEASSPAKYGSAEERARRRPGAAADRCTTASPERAQAERRDMDDEDGDGERRLVVEPRMNQDAVIRATTGGRVADLDGPAGGDGGWMKWSGSGGSGGGGSGGQPLLLSLADLTTAGLQKLLQAEGGSKMFFDPDSQRWVGEEVDLSGFEDPNTSSIGSTSAACAAAAAAAAAAKGSSNSPHRHRAESRSPAADISSPSPLYARGGGGSLRLPVNAHRRWSSGEGLYIPSSRRPSIVLEGRGEAVEGGGSGSDGVQRRKELHQRRHSVSVPSRIPLSASGGVRLEGSGNGTVLRPTSSASENRRAKGRVRSRPGSMVSSGISSESDTGSVVRLSDAAAPGRLRDGGGWGSTARRFDSAFGLASDTSSGGGGGGGGGVESATPPLRRKDLVVGGDHQRLAQVFEGAAYASSEGRVSMSSSSRRNASPPLRNSSPPPGVGPLEMWATPRPGASPPLGGVGGSSLASGSEIEASETSDWDQDTDFEGLPEDQAFKLTLEEPTKFGYSPGLAVAGGSAGGGDGGSSGGASNIASPIPDGNWLPPAAPDLLRRQTAPARTPASSSLGHIEAGGAFTRWPPKAPAAHASDGDGAEESGDGAKNRGHQRSGTYTDLRADSLGSAAEWDWTLEGELDLSLAQRSQTPVMVGPSLKKFTVAAGNVSGTAPRPKARRDGKSLPGRVPSKPAEASGCRGGGAAAGATKKKSPRSAVGIAWEAFKANGGGDSLPATLSAAMTATSIAVEHVSKRTRERLLLEKGAGAGKRLSGPVQITLEDLQTAPSPDRISLGEGGEDAGSAKSISPGATAAAGARFNRRKMCWEASTAGFEEPDLTGFDSTDSESESLPRTPGSSRSRSRSRSPSLSPPRKGGSRASMTVDERVECEECEERGPASSSASLQGLDVAAAAASGAADDAAATGGGDGDALRPSGDGGGGVEIDDEKASSGEDGGAADVVVGSEEGGGGRRGEERGSDLPSAAAAAPVQALAGAAGERRGSSAASEVMVSPVLPPAEPAGLGRVRLGGVDDEEKGDGSSRGGGNAGRELPLSLSDSRHSGGDFSDDVSDWDRSLRSLTSPPPGSPDLLVEGAPDPSQVPLMRRLSTAMLMAPKALKGPDEGVDAVAGDPFGGGMVGCLRRPSFGPLLFTPAGLAEQAMATMISCPEDTTAPPPAAGAPGLSPPSAAAAAAEPSSRHASPRAAAQATEMGGGVASADGGSPGGGQVECAGLGPVAAAKEETTESTTGVGSAAVAAGGGAGREESRRKGTGGRSRIRTISRRIYQRSTEEGPAPEGGENDARTSASHRTKSTEDYSVDDWGADFVGGIVLTPKTGGPGTMWGQAQEALEEGDEETDGTDGLDDTSNHQHGASSTHDSSIRPTRQHEDIFSAPAPPLAAARASLDPGDEQSAWSAPELILSDGSDEGERGRSSRRHRRTYAMTSITRFGSKRKLLLKRRGGDEAVASGREDAGWGSSSGEDAADGGGRDRGETPVQRRRGSKLRRRPKRTRGFQTISLAEYTPIYVPTAWLDPKSHCWKPVDGYAVDMSGFDPDNDVDIDQEINLSDAVAGNVPGNNPPPGADGGRAAGAEGRQGARVGGGRAEGLGARPSLSRGASAVSVSSSTGTCAGTPSSQERGCRRPSRGFEDRLAAFQLGPAALQHLATSEQAHDEAMTLFLGEQGYARAKREGAARLLRMPGVAAVAADEEEANASLNRKPVKRGSGGGGGPGRESTSTRSGGAKGFGKSKAAATAPTTSATAAAAAAAAAADSVGSRQPSVVVSLFGGSSSSSRGKGTSRARPARGRGGSSPATRLTAPSSRRPNVRPAAKGPSSASPSKAPSPSLSAGASGVGKGTPRRSRQSVGGGTGTGSSRGSSPQQVRGASLASARKATAAAAAAAAGTAVPSTPPRVSPYAARGRAKKSSAASSSGAGSTSGTPGSSSATPTPGRRRKAGSREVSPKTAVSQRTDSSRRVSPGVKGRQGATAGAAAEGGPRIGNRRSTAAAATTGGGSSSSRSPVLTPKTDDGFDAEVKPAAGRTLGRTGSKDADGRSRRSRSDSSVGMAAAAAAAPSSFNAASNPDAAAAGRSGGPRRRDGHKAAAAASAPGNGTPQHGATGRAPLRSRGTPGSSSRQRGRNADVTAAPASSPASTSEPAVRAAAERLRSSGAGRGGRSSSGTPGGVSPPRASSHVLRSLPRRSLGFGSATAARRATIASPPISPRAVRFYRAASSGRMSAWRRRVPTGERLRIGGGGRVQDTRGAKGGVSAEAEAAAVATAERERAARRLERFRYMAEFAANTVSSWVCEVEEMMRRLRGRRHSGGGVFSSLRSAFALGVQGG